jgi:hypothetical protein
MVPNGGGRVTVSEWVVVGLMGLMGVVGQFNLV